MAARLSFCVHWCPKTLSHYRWATACFIGMFDVYCMEVAITYFDGTTILEACIICGSGCSNGNYAHAHRHTQGHTYMLSLFLSLSPSPSPSPSLFSLILKSYHVYVPSLSQWVLTCHIRARPLPCQPLEGCEDSSSSKSKEVWGCYKPLLEELKQRTFGITWCV